MTTTASPTLLVLGTGAPDGDGHDAPDLLAAADAVFAGPPGPGPDADPEATALFYAEAWRVERLTPSGAAARLDAWLAEHPAGTAVLVLAGAPQRDVAFGAALDGLRWQRPALRVEVRPGAPVVPPRRTPLPG